MLNAIYHLHEEFLHGIQIPDLIMGLFEIGGSVAIWGNVCRILKDKQVRGVSPWATAFFTSWGFWNVYYYPHLGQWLAFWGGMPIVAGNVTWLYLMWRYRKS